MPFQTVLDWNVNFVKKVSKSHSATARAAVRREQSSCKFKNWAKSFCFQTNLELLKIFKQEPAVYTLLNQQCVDRILKLSLKVFYSINAAVQTLDAKVEQSNCQTFKLKTE